jgi:hypothetical protein
MLHIQSGSSDFLGETCCPVIFTHDFSIAYFIIYLELGIDLDINLTQNFTQKVLKYQIDAKFND